MPSISFTSHRAHHAASEIGGGVRRSTDVSGSGGVRGVPLAGTTCGLHERQGARASGDARGLSASRGWAEAASSDIGLAEALTINDKERHSTNQVDATARTRRSSSGSSKGAAPPARENILRCRRQIIAESTQIAQEARLDARISIRTLESIIKGLVPLDGTKSLILISASLAIDDRKELDTLFRLAEAARLSLNVILVDVPPENRNANRNAIGAID